MPAILVRERPIVSQPEFVLATRDTGYRNLAAAVAELLDNSIQANANRVRIHVYANDALARVPTPQIAVWDDGVGMDPESLQKSVQFGGTERFNDRKGLGRFGMGLPNSSVSIARRVDVFSWQRRGGVWRTYLDIDEVARGLQATVPSPVKGSIPKWVKAPDSDSGTLVLWSRCDRLDLRRPSAICRRLRRPLGRIYRQAIWSGLRIRINEELLKPYDPLFCSPETGEGGAALYGEPMRYELVAPRSGTSATVTVRFSELPVAAWHALSNDEKRLRGITGGAGVSFMRAGREIDFGWHLMGSKRKENYDDWWRCEVSFSPELDEYFGVTHSKQGVTPTTFVRAILEPDMEAAARQLGRRVRTAFETFAGSAASRAVVQANRQDRLLPAPSSDHNMSLKPGAGLSYEIKVRPIASREFFSFSQNGSRVTLILNEDHLFYKTIYRPLAQSSAQGRFAVESLLLAAVRAGLVEPARNGVAYIDRWSDALSAFLDGRGVKT